MRANNWNLESKAWNPESRTVLYLLTWGADKTGNWKLEFIVDFIYLGSVISNEDGFKFKGMLIR